MRVRARARHNETPFHFLFFKCYPWLSSVLEDLIAEGIVPSHGFSCQGEARLGVDVFCHGVVTLIV
jgi:hypothetical protein